jgi:hypothetical protein
MRIEERGNILTTRTTPGCLWLFGLWFVAGGLLGTVGTFFATNAHEVSWLTRAFVLITSACCAAAGLGIIITAPAVHAVFDRTSGRGVVTTAGLRNRSRIEFACRDVCGVELKEEKDSDGDPMYQIRIWLRDGRAIPLQSQPAHGLAWCAVRADAIRRFLGVKPSRRPSGH